MKHEYHVHIDLHLHRDESGDRVILDTLANILTHLTGLTVLGKRALMASAELKTMLARIDVATDNIAADVKRLAAGVKPNMTDAEIAEVQALGDAIATKLESIAASTEDPLPEP